MSRPVAAALLNQPGITALVGNRRALKQLAPGTTYPALVYSVVDVSPTAYVDDASGYEAMRLQVNPLATTIGGVQQIHDAVQQALDGLAQQTFAGRRVIAVRRDVVGPEDNATDDAGVTVWTWSRDYIVIFE